LLGIRATTPPEQEWDQPGGERLQEETIEAAISADYSPVKND
jgi:hypothetical protein